MSTINFDADWAGHSHIDEEIQKLETRIHELRGFKIAANNIDTVIAFIRMAESENDVQNKLVAMGLTEMQAKATINLRLNVLATMTQNP